MKGGIPLGSMAFHLHTVVLNVACAALFGQAVKAQDGALPGTNQRIVDFVRAHEGQKVGRGECWDLAAGALNAAGAKWDGVYGFGTIIDWKRDEVWPGDIVQFENVQLQHRTATSMRTEQYGQHTAVVVEVKARGEYVLAHQNVEPVGKKVALSPLSMSDVRSGKLKFYRPVAGGQ